MNAIFQQIADGFDSGSIYALLGVALVFVYRATGMINFAQGQMSVLALFVGATILDVGAPLVIAVIIAILSAMIIGAVTERAVFRRFEHKSEQIAVVVTIGLFILVTGIMGEIWGYASRTFPSIFPQGTVRVAGVYISYSIIGDVAVLLAVIGLLELLFRHSKLGLGLRAIANNPESSSLSGVPVGSLLMLAWALATGLATLGACLVAPKIHLYPDMMDFVLVYALAAAALGGFDSVLGTVLASWAIGIVQNLAGAYMPGVHNDLQILVPLAVMILILLLRPQGVFGKLEAFRV